MRTDDSGRCRKIAYSTRARARKALKRMKMKGLRLKKEKIVKTIYPCPEEHHKGWYHLTSKTSY